MSKYETHTMKDSGLPFILHITKYHHGRIDEIGNWHENVEILCFTGGKGTVTCNERRIEVQSGDIVVLNTNCIHTISCTDELYYYCLIVDRSFCLENLFDTNRICFDTFLRDDELFRLFEELATEWKNKADAPYRVQTIRAHVLRIMVILCRRYSRRDEIPQADSHLLSCIKQAIGMIHSSSQEDLSLEELAQRVGLSKFYFAREFHRITGYTVVSYMNLVRCEKAKRLLVENTKSVGEVGRSCGFSNQSYFSKIFFKHMGMRPLEYRNTHLKTIQTEEEAL